jgi:molybdenum cofactor cytidylyltransferase
VIGAVVLAAGGSSRLGKPKQLLRFGKSSLLRRSAEAALEAGCRPVVVVLGAESGRVGPEVEDLPVTVVVNERWREGMAASILAGVEALRCEEPGAEALLLLVCDQPHLSAELLRRLCAAFDGREGRRVACEYGGTVGVPALFHRSLFDRLAGLRGDRGAKSLLLEAGEDLLTLSWPEGATEIDRPEDWSSFRKRGPD